MSTTTLSISGMTCGHCVASVQEEIGALPGVTGVTVDLVNGGISTAVVTAEREVSVPELSEAVAEAGYTVVANDA